MPAQRRILLGDVGAQQIASLAPAQRPQLVAVQAVGEVGRVLVHGDVDKAGSGRRF